MAPRNNNIPTGNVQNQKELSVEELNAVVAELKAENASLQADNASLKAALESAQKEMESVKKTIIVNNEAVELEFLQATLENGVKLQFAQASHGDILALGMQLTPRMIMDMPKEKRQELIAELYEQHPTLFKEVIE